MDNNKEIKIKTFSVNPIEMNMYVVYDSNGEGVIIDPGCATEKEFEKLFCFTQDEKIKIVHVLVTHPHFDHVMGAERICAHYALPLELHSKAEEMLCYVSDSAKMFGFSVEKMPENLVFFEEGSHIKFGNTSMEVRYTPGHCQGSVCFVCSDAETVFSGDVLFRGSIGRTDLKTGDYDLLRESILNRVFVLDDHYTVRPGHGGRTTVEYEKYHNPFL
ncbi:MAG: MBL fold metallo-hydrolase [Bacteroidales bacterium]